MRVTEPAHHLQNGSDVPINLRGEDGPGSPHGAGMTRLPSPFPWLLLVALLAFLPRPTQAADWLTIGGTEPPQAEHLRIIGYVQPLYLQSLGEPLEGLETLTALNGRQAIFNTVGAGDVTSSFSVRRARLGVRGNVPGTEKRVNYFLQFEGGSNATTRVSPVIVLDASLTWQAAPGLRLRFGQFRLPTMDEAIEGIHVAGDFISYSNVAAQLLQENRFGWDEAASSNFRIGGSSGFRDVGVQAFDYFESGDFSYGYAVMLSNGRFGALDDDDAKDITARVQVARVFEGGHWNVHREEAMVFAWNTVGTRDYRDETRVRNRQGVGAHVNRHGFRFRGEYVTGRGMIPIGQVPPVTEGAVGLAPEGKARGWYLQGSWEPLPHWEANLRYDLYDREYDEPRARRIFRTWTFGGQYKISPRARLMVNYEMRALSAPGAGGDAARIADAMADRIGVQFTAIY